jgi:hypothetical protein
MLMLVQIVTLLLVTIALALSLAHALEFPGKRRLDKQAYYATQQIYYPGFTIGGISEVAGTLAAIVLLFLTPRASPEFWLTLVALLGLIAMEAVYWFVTHPVNRFWVEGVKLGQAGAGFFSFGTKGRGKKEAQDWTELRDRWEYSHVARAICASVSFVALLIALSPIA